MSFVTADRALLQGKPNLPTFLSRLMRLRGWQQADLAEALGVDQGTVSKWLNRTSEPLPKHREAIARVSGVEVDVVGGIIARTPRERRPSRRQLERRIEYLESVLRDHGLDDEQFLGCRG